MPNTFSSRLVLAALVFYLATLCAQPALAQTDSTAARKFDEFAEIPLSDLKARLDGFAIQLQNDPTARGFIIIYRARRDLPGINVRLAGWMKNYLLYSRGVEAKRVISVDGGVASCLTQQLWIAPQGTAPKPREDAYQRDYIDTELVRKFDEVYYPLPNDNYNGEDDEGEYSFVGDSLEAFAVALRKEPRALAYVVVYPGYYIKTWEDYVDDNRIIKHRKVVQDKAGTAARVSREVKAELASKYHIASSRIRVMDGGYRKSRQVELWIVPRGEHAPIPTPNAFPKKRRAR